MTEDVKRPNALPLMTHIVAAVLDNPTLVGPTIRPIVTVQMESLDGGVHLLPLTDISARRLLDTVAEALQSRDAQFPKGSFEPPKLQ